MSRSDRQIATDAGVMELPLGSPTADTPTHKLLYLLTVWARIFPQKSLSTEIYGSAEGPVDVSVLRAALLGRHRPTTPMPITVTGTFAPCLLLCSGWWERRKSSPTQPWASNTPLQEWLYFGFEQWAPSWDISLAPINSSSQPVLGQLGSGDEADSIAVILAGQHAERFRKGLISDTLVFPARVAGTLYHRSNFPKSVARAISTFGRAFDYCIKVDSDDRRHDISRVREASSIYSGYLWQCVIPDQLWDPARPPRLQDTYFVWEHTNFLNTETLAYNADSLQHKIAYLESRLSAGRLRLLQKSSQMVSAQEEPLLPVESFYNWLLDAGPPSKEDAR